MKEDQYILVEDVAIYKIDNIERGTDCMMYAVSYVFSARSGNWKNEGYVYDPFGSGSRWKFISCEEAKIFEVLNS